MKCTFCHRESSKTCCEPCRVEGRNNFVNVIVALCLLFALYAFLDYCFTINYQNIELNSD